MTGAGISAAGNGESSSSSSSRVAVRDGNGSLHLNGSGNSSSGSANGHSNGHATMTVPDEQGFKPLHEGSHLDRTEFIRITLQSLKELGFESSAKSLEVESGVTLEHTSIVAFRKAVLSGDWKNAERLLIDGLKYGASRLAGTSRGATSSADVSSVLRDAHFGGLDSIKFLLHQQRYLELLEARQTRKALSILRDRLAPLHHGSDRLHQLSSLVICATPEELRLRANWDGTGTVSRRKLLQEIESAVSPLVMIPSRRLPHLIEQAQQWQKTMDPFYNLPPDAQLSLYIDHQSDRSVFPTQTAAILKGHSDEVWHVAFSNDGTRLASVGQDKEAIIWTVGPTQDDFQILHRYGPHTGPICHAAWSPDDTMLLTSTQDGEVNVWNLNTGSKKEYREHIYSVGTATWLPDNVHFVTGGMDHKIVLWNIDGTKQHTWLTTPYRVQALAVSPDGKHLVALSIRTLPTPGSASSNLHGQGGAASAARSWTRSADEAVRTAAAGVSGNGNSSILIDDEVDDLGGGSRIEGDERQRILFFDLDKREEVGSVYLWDELTSVTFSDDSRHILVNQRPNESQIWNVQRQCLIMRLNGHKVQKHVIRSCFGGVERSFVISGSEDALIYVYHRKTGKLLEKLKGHGEGSVNSVAWHPTHHSMFASCSDDGTVRIWKPKAGGRSYADEILRMPASSDGHATNGHDRDSSMTEPSPFPWSNSPRSPASPTVMPSLAAVRSSAAVSSSLIVPSSEQTGEDEEEDEEEDDDEEDEEDDDDDDDDVMAE